MVLTDTRIAIQLCPVSHIIASLTNVPAAVSLLTALPAAYLLWRVSGLDVALSWTPLAWPGMGSQHRCCC